MGYKMRLLIITALLLQSCTYLTYTDTERSFRVVDLHPGGESISVQGALENLGTLDVNREHGSSEKIVDAAVGLGL